MGINVLEDVQGSGVDLNQVTSMAQRLINIDEQIERKTKELENLKQDRFRIATVDLPELMASANLTDIGVSYGSEVRRVEIKSVVTARLPSKEQIEKAKGDEREGLIIRREGAFAWLRENKAGDLIKYEVKVAFDKGKPIQGLLKMLARWKGISVKHDENVHFKTLEKFVRESLENGKDIPFELFGVWTGKVAEITK